MDSDSPLDSPSTSVESVVGFDGTSGTSEVMVFRPTMEEFKDFQGYIRKIEASQAHMKCGICKIIPPPEWTPRPIRGKGYDDVHSHTIEGPITQTVEGERGCFTQFNSTYKKKMTVGEFEKLAKSAKYSPSHAHFSSFGEMERYYWKNVTFGRPVYGADFHGSLYDVDDVDYWNINTLPSILDILTTDTGSRISIEGVNNAYMYYGMWKATFPWHTEDMDLYSINYIHYGQPKFWYAISHIHRAKFERLADMFFPQSKQHCKAFLRHKMYLISPSVLKQNCVPFGTMVQKAGEMIITFPGGYHAGFNVGYNAAESTNFASDRWIEFGLDANICQCRGDTVRINMAPFVEKFRPHIWPEYKYWYVDKVGPDSWPEKGVKSKVSSTVSKRNPVCTNQALKKRGGMNSRMDRGGDRKRLSEDSVQGGGDEKRGKESDEKLLESPHNIFDRITRDLPPPPPPSFRPENPFQNFDRGPPPKPGSSWEEAEYDSDTMDMESRKKEGVNMDICNTKELKSLWQWHNPSLEAEKKFNTERSLEEPHCSICQYFISKSLSKVAKEVPERSRKLVTELCFYRDPTSPSVTEDRRRVDQDYLITCVECGVTVHSSCYGVTTTKGEEWKCSRCSSRMGLGAECILCPMRGGALQKTTEEDDFVHVICALYNYKRTQFPHDVTKKPIKILPEKSDRNPEPCMFCSSPVGVTVPCKHTECQPPYYFHVTCGRLAGLNFELRDWPQLLGAICPNHDDQAEAEGLSGLSVGDRVTTWLDEGAVVVRGKVVQAKTTTFCVVDFDDGSFTNDIYTNDIIECSCSANGCGGAHASGAKVKVGWTDGTIYSGVFRRAYDAKMYRIEIEDPEGGDQKREVDCSRSELYGPKEIIPSMVKEKLNKVLKKRRQKKEAKEAKKEKGGGEKADKGEVKKKEKEKPPTKDIIQEEVESLDEEEKANGSPSSLPPPPTLSPAPSSRPPTVTETDISDTDTSIPNLANPGNEEIPSESRPSPENPQKSQVNGKLEKSEASGNLKKSEARGTLEISEAFKTPVEKRSEAGSDANPNPDANERNIFEELFGSSALSQRAVEGGVSAASLLQLSSSPPTKNK